MRLSRKTSEVSFKIKAQRSPPNFSAFSSNMTEEAEASKVNQGLESKVYPFITKMGKI